MSTVVHTGTTARTGRSAPGATVRLTAALLVLAAAAGCATSGLGFGARGSEGSLGRVIDALPNEAPATPAAPRPDRSAVLAAYAAIEGRLEDPATALAVSRRLADLTMADAEDRHADGAPQAYDEAIARYAGLVERTSGADRAEALYQLARAYDMAGSADLAADALDRLIAEHPEHRLVVEARFRRAELAFSNGRWHAAEADYAYVVTAGRDSPWWLNAAYMSGWARFKDGDAEGALERFILVLDTVPADTDQHELRSDTLRVATLALDYLAGAQTLAAAMAAHGQPAWQYDLYQALAQAYLERQRYLDSVTTWLTFVDAQPLDRRAPQAHRNAIDILRDADFPTEARENQARFVAAYGIDSAFWAAHDPAVRAGYLATLETYLDELARSSHAAAQHSGNPTEFAAAAAWYEELIRTFPDDADAAGYLFMLGELQNEAGNTAEAVAAYQRVMREYPDFAGAAEAGYAAILGLETLAAGADAQHGERLTRERIAAQIEFTERFPDDSRMAAVSTAAADGLLALGDHAAAADQAERLLAARPDLDPALRTTALTVIGHARFELGDPAGAEAAYRELLDGPRPDPLPDALREVVAARLQAAIYQQAEASEHAGAADAAIAHYLRVSAVDADSELAVQARFDAIAVLENAGRTAEAATQLDAFRSRYPDHALAAAAPRRLATLWERAGNQGLATGAWLEVADTDADPEIRRQALYRAAELALATGDTAAAARHFGRYVDRHAQPADLRMEALDHLDRLADAAGDAAARRQWLTAKIELERSMRAAGAAEPALARARALAAAAQYQLAREARARFDSLRLVNPLAESLERKQQALLDALAAFEAAAAYEVGEYVTASTWEIGDLYAALARALMESERPDGLSAEALEEYELLLEEQAFPFEEQAIAVHEINVQRSWAGSWDAWIAHSFADLGRLVPARFDRPEQDAGLAQDTSAACAAGTVEALALRRSGAFAAAEQHYLDCIAEHPDYGPAYLNLGILYELYLGRPAAALEAYRQYQALASEPDPRVAGWMLQLERRNGA